MTFSTSYPLCDKHMNERNVMYVRERNIVYIAFCSSVQFAVRCSTQPAIHDSNIIFTSYYFDSFYKTCKKKHKIWLNFYF
jgi:hypothetical protein